MFKFLKSVLGLGPSFRTPFQAHPTLGPAVGSAGSGDVRPLMAVFAGAGPDVSLRYASVEACVASYFHGSEHASGMYDAWVNNTPNDVYARLARAAFLLDEIPGYNPEDADAGAKMAEGERLRTLAAADIAVAKRLAPQDPVIDAFVLNGQRSDERDEALYESIVARAPHFFEPHRSIFWTHTERWGGATGDTLSFARALAGRSHGTELPLFVMYAHWERHWYLEGMCNDAAGAAALLGDPAIRNECLQVYGATLGAPQHRPTVNTWWFRQLASRWFYLVGKATSDPNDTARAKVEIERLGDVFVAEDSTFWWMTNSQYGALRTELGIA